MRKQQITPAEIWQFILTHEGQKFQTKRGNLFTYKVIGNAIQIEGNRPYKLSQGNFLAAIPNFNPENLGAMPQSIVGRSYVWGIFNNLQNQN